MYGPRSWNSSRRQLLAGGVTLGLGSILGGSARAQPRTARVSAQQATPALVEDDELLDRAFERIAARYPDVSVHRSNHAPMVSEALRVLGRADAIAPWLDDNLDRFEPTTSQRPIDGERWRDALGKEGRHPDWHVFFRAELEADGWQAVLRRWVPRFAPGLAGSATHGVIRAGHAARALAARDNPIRRNELAIGLAYWATNYEELPWDGATAAQPLSVEAALAKVEPRLPGREPPRGNIVSGLRALNETPSFGSVAGLVDTRNPAQTLTEMASAFARVYLRNPDRRIAFTHAVTAPSALRLLAPYLDEETVRAGVRYAWQAAAGLYVVYGDPRLSAPAAKTALARAEVVARAIDTGGAHAIKLTEACLREEALSHDPVLLAAAQDAAESQSM